MTYTQETSQYTCRVCANAADNTVYQVREMLHGTREEFRYFQCSVCGCLQISTVPKDLARYYPHDYQAYKNYHRKARNKFRRVLDSRRVHYEFTGEGLAARLLAQVSPPLDYVHWCKKMGIMQGHKVLDVGCGNGKLLARMLAGGFTYLRGIDPFIASDIFFDDKAVIHKTDLPTYLATTKNNFDLVMLHHSFEHMDNPRQVLEWCSQLLAEDGWILIRVPLADSYAWEKYRENWFALDAPRHLHLHSSKSMRILAEQAGFTILLEERDSIATQFTNSELYVRETPANAPREERDIFSKKQIREYERLAQQLNQEGRGDQ